MMIETNDNKPLSEAAIRQLRNMEGEARPRSAFNPGVIAKLSRANYIRFVWRDSPFDYKKKVKDRPKQVQFAEITEMGREFLKHAREKS